MTGKRADPADPAVYPEFRQSNRQTLLRGIDETMRDALGRGSGQGSRRYLRSRSRSSGPFPQIRPRSRVSVDVQHMVKTGDLEHAQDPAGRFADRESRALLLDPFAGRE
jgi:hypothetical protein